MALQNTTKNFSKKPIIAYFILTFLISWSSWIIAIIVMNKNGYALPSIMNFLDIYENGYDSRLHQAMAFLFTIGTVGPMISAIIVTKIFYGNEQLKEFFKRMLKFKVAAKWFGIIIGIPLIISLISILFNKILGGDISGAFNISASFIAYLAMFLKQIFSSGLEEPGWRGFATPELQKFKKAEDTGYIIGIFWGVWHFPFLIYLYIVDLGMSPFLVVISLVGYVALIVPMAIINVWIYNNTKSTGMLILGHALNNFIAFIVMGNVQDSTGGFLVAIITWIIAGILTKKYGKETLIALTEKELEERDAKKKEKIESKKKNN